MKNYKVLLSSKVYSERTIEAKTLAQARRIAKKEFDWLEEDAWACEELPQDKHYWRVEDVELEEI